MNRLPYSKGVASGADANALSSSSTAITASQGFPFSTAVTLRCTEYYHGTQRIIVGDSAFSSVTTLQELHNRGLYYMGVVKTAHSGYPKKHLEQWGAGNWGNTGVPSRGSFKLLKSPYQVQGHKYEMMAVGWKDRKLKTIIANTGTTLFGTPSKRKRHRVVKDVETKERHTETYTIEVPRPRVVESMFDAFNAVDVHDQYRQGILKMETNWHTLDPFKRILATVEGMIYTDAYLAYKYEVTNSPYATDIACDFNDFLDKLCKSMIFNNMIDSKRSSRAETQEGWPIDEV